MTRADALRTLGLPLESTIETIKHRFRQLARENHPDLFLSPIDKVAATARFQLLAAAYSFLLASSPSHSDEPSPPPHTHGAPPFVYNDRGADVSAVLAIIAERWPWLDIVLDLILGPYILVLSVAVVPLVFFDDLLSRSPRVRAIAGTICLRWLPLLLLFVLTALFVAQEHILGTIMFGLGALTLGALEIVAQILSITRLRSMRTQLVRTLERTEYSHDHSYSVFGDRSVPGA